MSYVDFQNRALEILEPGQKGDFTSKICDGLIALLVIVNILAVTLESVSDFSERYATQFFAFEFLASHFSLSNIYSVFGVVRQKKRTEKKY